MIRKYHDKDIAEVLDVWFLASSLAHPFLSEDFMGQERENIRDKWIPNSETWVYEHEDEVIGFISLIGKEVGAIFVAPDWHGQGFGRTLMDHAKSIHNTLEVEVFKENKIGRRFYDRQNFVVINEVLYEETGNQIIRMRWN
ncbi:MAG: N-acetyltransferase [SAR324 cluster bacterium]|nr:N-acetyltransferase [SAR324 cluster bacterium]